MSTRVQFRPQSMPTDLTLRDVILESNKRFLFVAQSMPLYPAAVGEQGVIDPNEPPEYITRYGGVGDGRHDDTTAFEKAARTGRPVFFPPTDAFWKVSAELNFTAVGQGAYGRGALSKIVQYGTGADAGVFRANGLGKNFVSDLWVVPNGHAGGLLEGFGAVFNASPQSIAQRVLTTGARRGAVAAFDSSYCQILDSWSFDSVVSPANGDTASDAGNDFYFGGNSSHNRGSRLYAINGCGFGFVCQTSSVGDVNTYNVFDLIVTKGQGCYAMFTYTLHPGEDTIAYNTFSNFIAEDILGDIPEAGGLFNYGAACYVAGAESTTFRNGIIRRCNVHAPDLNNVPAAVGFSGVENGTARDIQIFNAGYWGVACVQATATAGTGAGFDIGNIEVDGSRQEALYMLDCVRGNVSQFRAIRPAISGGADAVRIKQSVLSQSKHFVLTDIVAKNYAAGVVMEGTIESASLTMIDVEGNTGPAVVLCAATTQASGLLAKQGAGGTGVTIASTCVDGFLKDSTISGVGSTNGVVDDGGATLWVENVQVRDAATPFSSGMYRILADSATPTLRNCRLASIANVTTITNFLSGFAGQRTEILALANFTITNNATIKLAGAVNFAIASGNSIILEYDGSVWREVSRSLT